VFERVPSPSPPIEKGDESAEMDEL